jgi:hypothetical protein
MQDRFWISALYCGGTRFSVSRISLHTNTIYFFSWFIIADTFRSSVVCCLWIWLFSSKWMYMPKFLSLGWTNQPERTWDYRNTQWKHVERTQENCISKKELWNSPWRKENARPITNTSWSKEIFMNRILAIYLIKWKRKNENKAISVTGRRGL